VSGSCQPVVTRTEVSVGLGSQSSRIGVWRLEEKFCIVEESMVSVVCMCVHRSKTSSVNTRKVN
jgi:hypothetical protein